MLLIFHFAMSLGSAMLKDKETSYYSKDFKPANFLA